MHDPKYKFGPHDELYKRKDDAPTLLDYMVPAKEPVIVIRGKDPLALLIIDVYIASCQARSRIPGQDVDHWNEHEKSMLERYDAISKYQKDFPDRVGPCNG